MTSVTAASNNYSCYSVCNLSFQYLQSKAVKFFTITAQTMESFVKSLSEDMKQQDLDSEENQFVLALAGIVTSKLMLCLRIAFHTYWECVLPQRGCSEYSFSKLSCQCWYLGWLFWFSKVLTNFVTDTSVTGTSVLPVTLLRIRWVRAIEFWNSLLYPSVCNETRTIVPVNIEQFTLWVTNDANIYKITNCRWCK